jgi:DNA-binding NarL/FixJ family response regulator
MARIPQTCCLLAEDQALIGIALEATLEEAGIPVIGPFACAADALAWTQQDTPCVAILDYKLKDGRPLHGTRHGAHGAGRAGYHLLGLAA